MSNAQFSSSNVYFGGPDLKKNNLHNILLQSIKETPAGGTIDWMCYYLNDNAILDALIAAASRGVQITIFVDANPRIPCVNEFSISYLRKHESHNFQLVAAYKRPLWEYFGLNWHPHFHVKLYFFSHPTPRAFVGSYNPTAGADELPANIINEIGDHSISHNVLVNITESEIVAKLHNYISKMHQRSFRTFARLNSWHNRTHRSGDWNVSFLPNVCGHPIRNLLNRKEKADIKCAVSHLKGPGIRRALIKALQLGKNLEILLDSTERRVPRDIITFIEQHKIPYYQLDMPPNCLMHNKFILYKNEHFSSVMFGSYNWSARSRYLNHEIIASTKNKDVVNSFNTRWNQLTAGN